MKTSTKLLLAAAAGVAGYVVYRRMQTGATFTQAIGLGSSVPATSATSTATYDPTRASSLRTYVPAPTSSNDATNALMGLSS